LTAAEGGVLGHGVARVSSRVLVLSYRLLFRCKNSDVSNSNLEIIIISYPEHYYYGLYAYTYELSFHRHFTMRMLHLSASSTNYNWISPSLHTIVHTARSICCYVVKISTSLVGERVFRFRAAKSYTTICSLEKITVPLSLLIFLKENVSNMMYSYDDQRSNCLQNK
jgi:hypothetical protein